MFYLIIFFLLFIFSILEISNIEKINHRILIIFSWLILVLIAGLRYETGGDWDGYNSYFNRINPFFSAISGSGFGDLNLEFGFVLLCSIVKQFGLTIQTVYFLAVLLNITLITVSLKYYTKYVLTGLFVYYCILYFTLEMIITRQSIAVAICFYAMKYVKKEDILKYFIFIVIATMFHQGAIILFPLYFFFKNSFSTKSLVAIVFTGFFLMLFNVEWIKTILMSVSRLLGETFYLRAAFYITETSSSRNISIGFFLNIILFVIIMKYRKKIEAMKVGAIFINLFSISILVYYYFYELVILSDRFRYYFLIGIIVVFPYLIEIHKKYINKLLIMCCIALYSFSFSSSIFLEHETASAFNPYQNYLIYKTFNIPSTGKERLEITYRLFIEDKFKE